MSGVLSVPSDPKVQNTAIPKSSVLNWQVNAVAYADFQQDVWPQVDACEGFLSCLEAFFLYQTAKELRLDDLAAQPMARTVVEIGSFKGRSTVAIGRGLQENPNGDFRLVCVDQFFNPSLDPELKECFLKNIEAAGIQDRVACIAQDSTQAALEWPSSRGIALLWIDGNHNYEFVRDDFIGWKRFLVPSGIVAFHDWYLNGVRRCVDEEVFPQEELQDIVMVDRNLVAARKIEMLPTPEQRANKRRMYWAMRTGSPSLLKALLYMFYDWVSRPFGHISSFFKQKLNRSSV